jgi:hypothetical protein
MEAVMPCEGQRPIIDDVTVAVLASSWRSHDFRKLGKVQTLRFVELCEQYGFKRGADTPVKAQMLPLHEWPASDRTELQEMLDIAGS